MHVFIVVLTVVLTACSTKVSTNGRYYEARTNAHSSPRYLAAGRSFPKGGGHRKIGRPYQIAGRWYTPREQPGYNRIGIASWYGAKNHGRRTANGEIFDMNALTAAHPTLPIPSYAYVTNLANGRSLLVRVNDRGPFIGNRIIDLSRRVAMELGTYRNGTGRVRVRYAGPAPLNGNDAKERAYLRSRPWAR